MNQFTNHQTSGDDCRESGEGETMREQFEAWLRSKGLDIGNALLRVGPRKEMYYKARIQERWEAWQASRAAIEIDMNISTVGIYGRYVSKDEVVSVLKNAGKSVKE